MIIYLSFIILIRIFEFAKLIKKYSNEKTYLHFVLFI